MNITDKQIALATLDGAKNIRMSEQWEVTDPPEKPVLLIADWPRGHKAPLPDYHISYDAIIPLVQRLSKPTQYRMFCSLTHSKEDKRIYEIFDHSPADIADAVLKAEGLL